MPHCAVLSESARAQSYMGVHDNRLQRYLLLNKPAEFDPCI